MKTKIINGIPEIDPKDAVCLLGQALFIDVRRPEEYTGELGHIDGAVLATLGPELMETLEAIDRSKEIIFICRSGSRSGQATALSHQMGFNSTANMTGGMLLWNELGLPVERSL